MSPHRKNPTTQSFTVAQCMTAWGLGIMIQMLMEAVQKLSTKASVLGFFVGANITKEDVDASPPQSCALILALAVAWVCLNAFPAQAASGNYLDRIDFGSVQSEGAHAFMPGTDPSSMATGGIGAYGRTYRLPSGNGNNNIEGSQVLTFSISCDPVKQNYLTIKLWGSDNDSLIYLIDANNNFTLQDNLGFSPDVSFDVIANHVQVPTFPNRFFYYTLPIPLALTTGNRSVQLSLLTCQNYNRYATDPSQRLTMLAQGQAGRPIYSAFSHTDTCFIPDAADVLGTAPAVTGMMTNYTAITSTQAIALMQTVRSNIFTTNTGYIDSLLARQIWTNNYLTNGYAPPPETIGLDLHATVSTWPATDGDGWRQRVAAAGAFYTAGYTAFSGELIIGLASAYLAPPFTNASGSVVAGLDRYHDTNIFTHLVKAVDASTYLIDSDGGFCQQGNGVATYGDAWTGLCSTNNPRTHGSYTNTTARLGTVHGGGDLQGVTTYALGWAINRLLNDTNGATNGYTALISLLNINNTNNVFDADLNGGSMPRVYAWERMLFQNVNWYANATGGQESQNLFQMLGMFANWTALNRLQVLYPNTNYVVHWSATNSTYYNGTNSGAATYLGTNSPLDGVKMVMGIIPDTLRGMSPSTNPPGYSGLVNYGMTAKGLGEGAGALSCALEGDAYGRYLSSLPSALALLAAWDTNDVDSSTLARIQSGVSASMTAWDQLISPLYNITNPVIGGFASNAAFSLAGEDFVTSRSFENLNSQAGTFQFNLSWAASGTNGVVNNPSTRRGAYLSIQYGQATPANDMFPVTNNVSDLEVFEKGVRSLINVNPATLPQLPGESWTNNFVWFDVQSQAVALMNRGERLYLNCNWRRTPGTLTQWGRIHYTTSHIERGATFFMPYNTNTVQRDGNYSSTNLFSTYVVRYGDYLIALNSGSNAALVNLPTGYGQAQDLVSSNYYNLGSSVTVAPSNAVVFWLPATNTMSGSNVPVVVTPATASLTNVTGTTVSLSVLGTNAGGGTLTYTWSLAGTPPAPVLFSTNASGNATNVTATFAATGTYTFNALIANATGTTNSAVIVTVVPKLTSVGVLPANQIISSGDVISFWAAGYDQFGYLMSPGASPNWSVSGAGAISPLGVYAAPTNGGTATVNVTLGGLSGSTGVTVLAPVGGMSASTDIGSPALTGSSSYSSNSNSYTILGAGKDVWSTNDQFQYAFEHVTGDATITARVVSFTYNDGTAEVFNAKAGVMFRDGSATATASPYAFCYWSPPATTNNSIRYEYRSSLGGNAASSGAVSNTYPLPYWIRTIRQGDTFSSYYSPDGTNWSQLGSTLTISMNDTVNVGLAVCSFNTNKLGKAVFDNVSVTQPTNATPVIFPGNTNIISATAGSYVESLNATNSASNTVTLTGQGGDIWSTADSVQYAYTPLIGNGTLTARVVSFNDTAEGNPKVGVMIRQSLDGGAPEACTTIDSGQRIRSAIRAVGSGTTTEPYNVSNSTYVSPYWMRIARTSNSFVSSVSTNGSNWTLLATNTVTMSNTVYAGLVIASLDANNPCTTLFDNISFVGATNTPPVFSNQPSVSLTNLTASLSVLASDDGGAFNLTYTWYPVGQSPGNVTFSTNNGSSTATNVTVTLGVSGIYYFEVLVTDAYGTFLTSNILTLVPPPSPPSSLSAAGGTNSASLNWSASSGAVSYSVKRATNSGGPYSSIATGVSSISYTDTNLPSSGTGISYYYVVTAVNSQSESANSPEASALIVTPPAAPTNLMLSGSGASSGLNWSASSGATSYAINSATNTGGPYTNAAASTNTTFSLSTLPTGTNSYVTVSASNAIGMGSNSTEFWWITTPTTESDFTPYGGIIGFAQTGSLTISNSAGTYTSSVTRATGLMVNGGQSFVASGTGSEPANLVVMGTTGGNTVDAFGDLTLFSGPFFGRLSPAANGNLTLNFKSLTRSVGAQLNFAHSANFGTGVGSKSIGTSTNNASVVFNNAPTNLMVGGGGTTNTSTVNILPFVFVNNQLATYDSVYGLRALSSNETTTTLTSGASTTANVKVNATNTLSAATTVNALYLTKNTVTGAVTGSGSLKITSGAIVADQNATLSVTTLNFGSAEGMINVANARTLTLSSVITGSNGLSICLENYNANTAVVILGGANTFTGVTRFLGNNPAMTVRLTNSLALQNSTLDYNNYGAAFSLGNGGISGLTNYTFGGLSGAQNIALTNNNTSSAAVALTVGGDNDSTLYSGVLSGTNGSLIKIGTGTLTLSGTNTFTGTTTVSNGTLCVSGSVAGGVTMKNGGVLAFSDASLKTNSISGAFVLNGGAALSFDIGSTSDRIALTGTYTVPTNGTVTVNINALTNFGVGTYTLITGATNISATNFVIGSAPSGYGYSFSSASNTLSLVVSVVPAAPGGLSARGGNNQVILSWAASTGASAYNLYRSVVSGTQGSVVATNISTSNYADSGLSNGTAYYYEVSGVNSAGEGTLSTQVGATPLSGYQQWLASNNLAITNTGSATPDGDGVALLLKYATVMTPGVMCASGPASIGATTNNHLTLQFNRLKPATQEYVVEATTDLTNWSTITDLLSGSNNWTGSASVVEVGTNTPVAVTVTDTATFTTNGERFLRLRIPGAHGTIPQGYMALTINPSATTALSLPLDNTPAARGYIQGVGTNTLTITNTGVWTNATSPYAIRILSGNGSGATFPIIAQSNTVLILANQGVDLTQLVATNDPYEMLPIDTLEGFFGTNGGGLQTGASASSADNLQLWNGSAWIAYYNNGSNWKQSGSLLTQNNTQLPSGAGWLLLKRGTNALTFYALGVVPEVPIRQFTKPGSQTFLAGPYPASMTLGTSGFSSAAAWQSGASASSADNMQLWNGSAWLAFYYNGTNWKQSGSLLIQNGYVLSAGQPMFIQRRSTPTPAQSFILFPQPYTP